MKRNFIFFHVVNYMYGFICTTRMVKIFKCRIETCAIPKKDRAKKKKKNHKSILFNIYVRDDVNFTRNGKKYIPKEREWSFYYYEIISMSDHTFTPSLSRRLIDEKSCSECSYLCASFAYLLFPHVWRKRNEARLAKRKIEYACG